MKRFFLTVLALSVLALRVSPAHAATKTICFRYPVTTVDSGVGEDFGAVASTEYFAAALPVVAQQSGSGLVNYSFTTDASGCVNLNVTNTGVNWIFAVTAQATITGNKLQGMTASNSVGSWLVNWQAPASWTSKVLLIPKGRLANIMGIGTFTLTQNPIILTTNNTIRLHDQDCPPPFPAGRSCQTGNDFYVSAEHSSRKFVIAHEIGHIVMALSFGMPNSGTDMKHPRGAFTSPNTEVGGLNCEWAPGDDHMMTSWEWSTTAYIEGWAQFYSTLTWNAPSGAGFLQYHKLPMTFGTVTVTPPGLVNMETGSNFLATCDCGGGAASCTGRSILKIGSGTELDWGRQFWDFYTNSGVKPDLTKMELGLAYGGPQMTDHGRAWDGMKVGWQSVDSAFGTLLWDRWNSLDHINGINYCVNGADC